MSGSGQATGAALALCEVMGWDTNLGRSDGIPNGGQLAVEVIDELRESGWHLVRLESTDPVSGFRQIGSDVIDHPIESTERQENR